MLLKNGVFDQLRRVGLRKHELSQNPTLPELPVVFLSIHGNAVTYTRSQRTRF